MLRSGKSAVAATLLFYGVAFALVVLPSYALGTEDVRVTWAIYAATLLLYGGLTVAAVVRRPRDPRVILFMFTGFAVSLTILFDAAVIRPGASAWDDLLLFLYSSVYMMNFAVVVHMASLIPRANPITRRHRWIVGGTYATGALLTVVSWLLVFSASRGSAWFGVTLPSALQVRAEMSLSAYVAGACISVWLLQSAARREETREGRLQALVVLAGILPWAANITAWLFIPAWRDTAAGVIEPFAVMLVPAGFYVSIFHFHLFDLGSFLRRGLIYVLTMGMLGASVYLAGALIGLFAAHVLGIHITLWWIALLFFIGGAFFQPLSRAVESRIDQALFSEKIALRRLEASLIGELAGFTEIDEAAAHLIERIHTSLSLRGAALLLADQGGEYYRVRAISGRMTGDETARNVVLTAEELQNWSSLRPRVPMRRFESDDEPAELRGMLDLLETEYVVPVRLKDRLVAVLALGKLGRGAALDRDDLEILDQIAQQASAMLENARLFDLATHDPLTRLPRRQVAVERLREELRRATRSFHPLAIAFADIDDFKQINDTWGHHAGDVVIRAIARAFSERSRSTDIVARFGGEEFVFVLPDTPRDGAYRHLEELRAEIETREVDLDQIAPVTLLVTLSFGLYCLASPDQLCTEEEALVRADEALYVAKRNGKNRVEIFDQAPRRMSVR
ncbi:MAG: diguanylate cyclase [Thermoanaerobaculia bacterium]